MSSLALLLFDDGFGRPTHAIVAVEEVTDFLARRCVDHLMTAKQAAAARALQIGAAIDVSRAAIDAHVKDIQSLRYWTANPGVLVQKFNEGVMSREEIEEIRERTGSAAGWPWTRPKDRPAVLDEFEKETDYE